MNRELAQLTDRQSIGGLSGHADGREAREFGSQVMEATGAPSWARGINHLQNNQPGEAIPEFLMGALNTGSLATLPYGAGPAPRVPRIQRALPEIAAEAPRPSPQMQAIEPPQLPRTSAPDAGDAGAGDLFPESAPGPVRVYHGTTQDFAPDQVRPWSHFGTERAARQRLEALVDPEFRDEAPMRVLSYEITGRRIDVGDEFTTPGMETSPTDIADMLLRGRHITPEEHAWALEPRQVGSRFEGRDANEVVFERLSDLAERHDIGAIGYRNAIEDAGSRSYIVPNPRNVRAPQSPDGGGAGGGRTPLADLARQDPINATDAWGRGVTPTDEMVREAMASGARRGPASDAEVATWGAREHAERIATLMREGWNDPIALRQVEGRLAVNDGYHRLAAARLRGDRDIPTRLDSSNGGFRVQGVPGEEVLYEWGDGALDISSRGVVDLLNRQGKTWSDGTVGSGAEAIRTFRPAMRALAQDMATGTRRSYHFNPETQRQAEFYQTLLRQYPVDGFSVSVVPRGNGRPPSISLHRTAPNEGAPRPKPIFPGGRR